MILGGIDSVFQKCLLYAIKTQYDRCHFDLTDTKITMVKARIWIIFVYDACMVGDFPDSGNNHTGDKS